MERDRAKKAAPSDSPGSDEEEFYEEASGEGDPHTDRSTRNPKPEILDSKPETVW